MGIYSNYKVVKEETKAVNEVYFGMSPQLEAIIEQLGKFRRKYQTKFAFKTFQGLGIKDINADPELVKFNRMVEDFFGFHVFSLYIDMESDVNGYTYGIPVYLDQDAHKSHLQVTKTGFRFDKNSRFKAMVYVYAGLILDSKYTDREVMAVIIHEIGHNFVDNFDDLVYMSGVYYRLMTPLSVVYAIINIINSVARLDLARAKQNARALSAITDTGRGLYLSIREKLLQNPVSSFIYNGMNRILGLGQDVLHLIITPFLFFPINPMQILAQAFNLLNPIALLDLIAGYRNEKISDNFATMYGLGSDLSSALLKMGKAPIPTVGLIKKVPILGWFYDLINIPSSVFLTFMNPHPETAGRVANQVKYLRNELKKQDLDPKMKKEIEADLDKLDKTVDEQIRKGKPYRGTIVGDMYNLYVYEVLGGDIRDLNKSNPDDDTYNRKFDDMINRIKLQ